MMSTGAVHELLELGVISPEPKKAGAIGVGEVGYLMTGVKDVRQSRVGDTVTINARPAKTALGGYKDPKPMVYSGLYPIDGSEYPNLRDALDKLKLNDAALHYEPETSAALGFGFRCGFLGLLHLEIIRERLERESNLDLISTAPNVVYRVVLDDGGEHTVTNPSEYPTGKVAEVFEPVVRATVLTPNDYVGAVMELCQGRRGTLLGMDYLSADRVELRYTLPLAEIIYDFFDQLKSRTKGYASLDYEPSGEQQAELVKVDILLHGEAVDAFSAIVHKDKAYNYGVCIAAKLRALIPRQQFEVPIQAAIGSRIIARETIRAIRKDVLAKCYGGDITRKRKLLEKQKEGKKRMKMVGRVEVPQEAFIAALSTSDAPPEKGSRRQEVTVDARFCPRCGAPLPGQPPTLPFLRVRALRQPSPDRRPSSCRGTALGDARVPRAARARDRERGWWDLPGGFCDGWEHPADAAVREAREELGVEVRLDRVRRHVRRQLRASRARRCRCSTASGWPPWSDGDIARRCRRGRPTHTWLPAGRPAASWPSPRWTAQLRDVAAFGGGSAAGN